MALLSGLCLASWGLIGAVLALVGVSLELAAAWLAIGWVGLMALGVVFDLRRAPDPRSR